MDIVCASPCAHQYERSVPYVDRSRAADGVIRRLFDVGAGIRVENDGKRSAFYGERLLDIVPYVVVEYLDGV